MSLLAALLTAATALHPAPATIPVQDMLKTDIDNARRQLELDRDRITNEDDQRLGWRLDRIDSDRFRDPDRARQDLRDYERDELMASQKSEYERHRFQPPSPWH